jgi:hypothetical protein
VHVPIDLQRYKITIIAKKLGKTYIDVMTLPIEGVAQFQKE